jgi:preprotein translocase subunit SecB
VIAAQPSDFANSGQKLMTDAANPEAAASAGPPMIRVLAQYVKDLSFENPGLFATQQGNAAPEIELGIDVRVEPGPPADKIFAVELKLSARAKRQDTVVFIVELVYAGVVQLQDSKPEDAEPMLLIECPRLLFPFARRIIADVTREGGHPPLMIDPIDFVGLYRQQRERAAAAAQQPAAG